MSDGGGGRAPGCRLRVRGVAVRAARSFRELRRRGPEGETACPGVPAPRAWGPYDSSAATPVSRPNSAKRWPTQFLPRDHNLAGDAHPTPEVARIREAAAPWVCVQSGARGRGPSADGRHLAEDATEPVGPRLGSPTITEMTPAVRPIELSAHHALCVHGFRGMGYSADFVASLSAVVARLRDVPSTPVRVRIGSDAVCRACPSLSSGGCMRYGQSVVRQDARVAERLGVVQGEEMPWSDLRQRVRDTVAPEDLTDLCGGCPWLEYGVCAEGLRELRAGLPLRGAGRPS